MKEYYPKYSEVPKDIYDQVKSILKGYDRLKRERVDLLHGASYRMTGMPHSGDAGDQTARKAVKLACINERLEAIDQASMLFRGLFGEQVHEEFDPLKAYWNYNYFNYQHKRAGRDDNGPSPRTWNRYKHRYTAVVAEKLKLF